MADQLIITTVHGKTTGFFYYRNELEGIEVIPQKQDTDAMVIGNIYKGRVKNIVKNINAAFVDVGGQMVYYSLEDNRHTIFLNHKTNTGLCVGDEVLVQIEKEPVKTKNASGSCYFNLHSEHLVFTYQKPGIGISKKITDTDRRTYLQQFLQNLLKKKKAEITQFPGIPLNFGIIVRTNAEQTTDEVLERELDRLLEQFQKLIKEAVFAKNNGCVYSPSRFYEPYYDRLKDGKTVSIVTDVKTVYDAMKEELSTGDSNILLQWYEEELPLTVVYDLSRKLDEALSKKVWLKSGANLVLEPTEALTVIDVNTGKSIQKKRDKEEHLLEINLEAAREVARQLKLRNYSGIIIVDFIDMKSEQHNKKLLSELKAAFACDSVKTTVVEMTKLGLVEITRHKITKPLYEQLRQKEEF